MKKVKLTIGLSLLAIVSALTGYSVQQQAESRLNDISLQNIEALSNLEYWGDVCFFDYDESTTVFEYAFSIRKCIPCGFPVWVTRVKDPYNCH